MVGEVVVNRLFSIHRLENVASLSYSPSLFNKKLNKLLSWACNQFTCFWIVNTLTLVQEILTSKCSLITGFSWSRKSVCWPAYHSNMINVKPWSGGNRHSQVETKKADLVWNIAISTDTALLLSRLKNIHFTSNEKLMNTGECAKIKGQ